MAHFSNMNTAFPLSIGELVLTRDGIYRWAGEAGATEGSLDILYDYRFNAVPNVTVSRNGIGPAYLDYSLDFADLRIILQKKSNASGAPRFHVEVEGPEKWKSWAYEPAVAILEAARYLAIRDWHEAGCPVNIPQQPQEERSEIPSPSILDDFEEGDKVFTQKKKPGDRFTDIGIVVSVESDHMWVSFPNGGSTPRRITTTGYLQSPFHLSHWRKMPNDELIQKGNIISTSFPGYLSVPNGRESFVVTKIIPGEALNLKSLKNPYHTLQFDSSEYDSLEQYLQHWQIEG